MTEWIKAIIAAGALLLGAVAAQADEGPAYTESLPKDPVDITRAFFIDHTAWNNYAHAHLEETKDLSGPKAAYRRLIDLYCGPGKRHQGITFGSDPDFDAQRSEIIGKREQDGQYTVKVRHTGSFDFVADFNFVFKRNGKVWRLDEVYYYDDHGDEWLPSL